MRKSPLYIASVLALLAFAPTMASANPRSHRDSDRGPHLSFDIGPGYNYRHSDRDRYSEPRYSYDYSSDWRDRHGYRDRWDDD